jgi:hypothetical protein
MHSKKIGQGYVEMHNKILFFCLVVVLYLMKPVSHGEPL